MVQDLLQTITDLSHEFGCPQFVKGGGGNTSVKTADTLFVKPSGTTLASITPEKFVVMNRAKLSRLYDMATPSIASEREALVKKMMEEATESPTGRASVEAPLHNCLSATYIVHTHPPFVNALTCGLEGRVASSRLFPEALWIEYIDPGYTLCMHVKKKIDEYATANGKEPDIIFLKNHGVFVGGNSVDEIRSHYAHIFSTLISEMILKATPYELCVGPTSQESTEFENQAKEMLETITGTALKTSLAGPMNAPEGPLTPDHIVYMKSYAYQGELSEEGIRNFIKTHGYAPKIIVNPLGCVALEETENSALLAMTLLKDATLIRQLASAFGGVEYMSTQAREFIENWEVESYRKKQMAG